MCEIRRWVQGIFVLEFIQEGREREARDFSHAQRKSEVIGAHAIVLILIKNMSYVGLGVDLPRCDPKLELEHRCRQN